MTGTVDFNERCYPDCSPKRVTDDHIARYNFALAYASGKDILDMGCGEGYGVNIMKKASPRRITGIDSDKDTVTKAALKYAGIDFMAREATMTGFVDNQFDLITCFEVWHHLDLFVDLIPECARILKPGGILIASVPNAKIIYLNPFHRRFLTKYYRTDFSRRKIMKHLEGSLELVSWFGQRFVNRLYANPLSRMILFFLSALSRSLRNRIDIAFKIADGPAVRPAPHENSRTIVFIARKPASGTETENSNEQK